MLDDLFSPSQTFLRVRIDALRILPDSTKRKKTDLSSRSGHKQQVG